MARKVLGAFFLALVLFVTGACGEEVPRNTPTPVLPDIPIENCFLYLALDTEAVSQGIRGNVGTGNAEDFDRLVKSCESMTGKPMIISRLEAIEERFNFGLQDFASGLDRLTTVPGPPGVPTVCEFVLSGEIDLIGGVGPSTLANAEAYVRRTYPQCGQ